MISNKIKIFLTGLCLIMCNSSIVYSMQDANNIAFLNSDFAKQVNTYMLKLSGNGKRTVSPYNMTMFVFDDTNYGYDLKLIATAIAANSNAINWSSTVGDITISYDELYGQIYNLISFGEQNVNQKYDEYLIEQIRMEIDEYENCFNISMPKCLLQKTNQELFNNPEITIDDFTDLLMHLRCLFPYDITLQEHKSVLKWLLYCSISKLISLFPNDLNINDLQNFINNKNINNININVQEYYKYCEITLNILQFLTHCISGEIYDSNMTTNNPIRIIKICFYNTSKLCNIIKNYIIECLQKKYNTHEIPKINEDIVLEAIISAFRVSFACVMKSIMTQVWQNSTMRFFANSELYFGFKNKDFKDMIKNKKIPTMNDIQKEKLEQMLNIKSKYIIEKIFYNI